MLELDTAMLFFGSSLLLGLAPGPDNLFVLAQAAQRGSRAGLVVTMGLCTGLVVHTTLPSSSLLVPVICCTWPGRRSLMLAVSKLMGR